MRVLVTGATGFIGQQLCASLADAGYRVRAALRTDRSLPAAIAEKAVTGEIGSATSWGTALTDVDVVVHVAAHAHVLHESAADAERYMETNVRGTARLAVAAARYGVRRFVLLSSVKVNGEGTAQHAYSVHDEPHPADAYGRSKWLAEQRLWETVSNVPMQAAVVRAPLVYGPGVRANFLRLLHWVDRGRVLPLGAVENRRSLVSAWTLCDLLIRLLDHPAAVNRTWMVSDGEDISTPELVRRIARAMGRRARLLSVPAPLLRLVGGMSGKGVEMRRLCSSLTVDIAATRKMLGWSPPISMDDALVRTVAWYQSYAHLSP